VNPCARRLAAAAVVALASLAASFARAESALVTGIRFWTNEEYTRVAIDLTADVRYEARFLPADPARNLPPRVFVDLAGARVREEILRQPVEVKNGLLRVVRAGRFRPGVVRVVIDLERESAYRVFDMAEPCRIIVDIEGKGSRAREEVPGPVEAGGDAAPQAVDPGFEARGGGRQAAGRPVRVMLDPGHGGKDPGAIGPSGLMEKDVVLALGRLVRARLEEAGGFEVRMTRDADLFVPLEERTAMANRARADIFVSLHINASRNRRAEGISTYVLSRSASDREALELAARENGVPLRKLEGVRFIIDDLFFQARKNESLRLAKTVNDAIVRKVRGRHPDAEDLGLRQAPFYVLVGARMTAILVEASFITNPREEARLADRRYLEAVAEGVVDAIRQYAVRRTVARAGS